MRSWYSRCGFNEAHIGGVGRGGVKNEDAVFTLLYFVTYILFIKGKAQTLPIQYHTKESRFCTNSCH